MNWFAFGSTYEAEEARPDSFWIDRAAGNAAMRTTAGFVAGGIDPIIDEPGPPFAGIAVGAVDEDFPDMAWLFSMWVAPEARGRGLGLLLIRSVCDWAHGVGRSDVRLEVHADNAPALGLYRRAGFADAEHIPERPEPPCEVAMSRPALLTPG